MGAWLYPISKRPKGCFILKRRRVPVSIETFRELVRSRKLAEDRPWGVPFNINAIQPNDEFFIYTGDEGMGIIGYATVQKVDLNSKRVQLDFDFEKCTALLETPVPASVVHRWIHFPRGAVRDLNPYLSALEKILPWKRSKKQIEKLYRTRARQALPLLVRQAKAGNPIIYSDLADELSMPNPRNLDRVLGEIGNNLRDLAKQWGVPIPPIQFLVHQKGTRVPGPGVDVFTDDVANYRKLNLRQKRRAIQPLLARIYAFNRWNDVLKHFGLRHASPAVTRKLLKRASSFRGGGGESAAHRRLKDFVARNSHLVERTLKPTQTDKEFRFSSGDPVDVLFRNTRHWLAVEVKAANAPDGDILRGLFQCVKYCAVAKAMVAVQGGEAEVDAVLVLEGSLPPDLVSVKNTLAVRVIERIVPR
jgi:hypothetical protein